MEKKGKKEKKTNSSQIMVDVFLYFELKYTVYFFVIV